MRRVTRAQWWLLVGLLLCVPLAQAHSRHAHDATSGVTIPVAELPPEARATLQLIEHGGPFPYPRDGVVFGNYERVLPQQQRGYYHEYTVKTPGARNRGARRFVCGAVPARGTPVGSPLPECYYTDDHYRSFHRIRE